jgi:hypothetical protein
MPFPQMQSSPDPAAPQAPDTSNLSDPSLASGGYSGTPQPTSQAPAVPAGVHPAVAEVTKHAIFGRALRSLVHSIEGTRTVYQPNPQTGTIEETTVQNKPGQLFRNILMGSLIGGAAASERSSGGAGGGGFLGGFARGGSASFQNQRQQDQARFARAQEQLKSGMDREKLSDEEQTHAALRAHEFIESAAALHNMHTSDEKSVEDHNAASRAYSLSLKEAGATPFQFTVNGRMSDSIDGTSFQQAFTKDPTSITKAPEGMQRHFVSNVGGLSELHYDGQQWRDDSGELVNLGPKISISAWDLPSANFKTPIARTGKEVNAARRQKIVDPNKTYMVSPEGMSSLYSLGLKDANEEKRDSNKKTFTTIASKKASALAKAEHEYNVAVNKNPDQQDELQQQLRDAKQQAQDSFEEEVESAGGSTKHFEYPSVSVPKPAQPQAQTQQPTPGSRPILKGGRTVGYYTPDGKRVDY